jgi:hypothetical protein
MMYLPRGRRKLTSDPHLPEYKVLQPYELRELLEVGDILLPAAGIKIIRTILETGQYRILRKFGTPHKVARYLSKFVHAMTVCSEDLEVFEIFPAGADTVSLPEEYTGVDCLVLRVKDKLSDAELDGLLTAINSYKGASYDYQQYLIYPFYMLFGSVPGFIEKHLDDPDRPVCSGLCIRLLQAAGRLLDITDYVSYPPARMPLIDELDIKFRFKLSKSAKTKKFSRRPWWV